MRSILKNLTATSILTLTLTTAVPVALVAPRALAADARVQPDRKKTIEHLTKHQTYPATRAELLASCNNLVDFSDGEKQWFAARLPEGTYRSADDVLKVLFNK